MSFHEYMAHRWTECFISLAICIPLLILVMLWKHFRNKP